MPYKSDKERKAYQAGYQSGLRNSKVYKQQNQKRAYHRYQENRADELKRREKINRRAGHKERVKGAKFREEIEVPAGRRWRIFEGRVYFTSKKGFTLEELREVLRAAK